MNLLGQSSFLAPVGDTLRANLGILPITNGEANRIVKKHHYLHRARTGGLQLSHGVFYKGVLSGCFVWASPTFHHFRGQCQAAGVRAWVKQDSGRFPGRQGRIPDELWALKEMP